MLTEQEKIRIREEVIEEEQKRLIGIVTKCLMKDFGLSEEKAIQKATQYILADI